MARVRIIFRAPPRKIGSFLSGHWPFGSFWQAISEPGWTRRQKAPLGVFTKTELRAFFFDLDPTGSQAKKNLLAAGCLVP